MSITTRPRQPEAGKLLRAHRQALGLQPQDFCDLVKRQRTKYGRVNLDRTTLWRYEEEGLVPFEPRMWAISEVLGVNPGAIWTFKGHRLVDVLIDNHRKAAA